MDLRRKPIASSTSKAARKRRCARCARLSTHEDAGVYGYFTFSSHYKFFKCTYFWIPTGKQLWEYIFMDMWRAMGAFDRRGRIHMLLMKTQPNPRMRNSARRWCRSPLRMYEMKTHRCGCT
eukprot:1541347-Pleurochrysis_carterae.AAC.1